MKSIGIVLLLASLLALCACGGGTNNAGQNAALSGNWQFTLAAPADHSFQGGLQGGFLLQDHGTVTGGAVYLVSNPPATSGASWITCRGGSAAITGTLTGQTVALTAAAGGQAFTLTGTLSGDGSTMIGTYDSTPGRGTTADGKDVGCGTAQTGLSWSAHLVPPLTGPVQGYFHSLDSLDSKLHPVTGFLTQDKNIGASNAGVTGSLTFQNYSCLGSSAHQTVSVNGEISGRSVLLQVIDDKGLNIGQIGSAPNSQFYDTVSVDTLASGDIVLRGTNGYSINTAACPAGNAQADTGNLCLALGQAMDCTQPISFSPATLSFPAQIVGAGAISQTVTITNTDPMGSLLSGLRLTWSPGSDSAFGNTASNFDGLPNFTEQDTCTDTPNWATLQGPSNPNSPPFSLGAQQSCTVTVTFSPQQSCPWISNPASCLPFGTAKLPAAKLTVNRPTSSSNGDTDTQFPVPITGSGLSALWPSTPELDFGAEAISESSLPQTLTFTNQGLHPVTILPPANQDCAVPMVVPQPVQAGEVAGLQIVTSPIAATVNGYNTVSYNCDFDPASRMPKFFQISSDSCTGRTLGVMESCSVSIAFAPRFYPGGPAYLELNTRQCQGSAQTDCEIDSGRFPVMLTANGPSPLRMSPGAALEFGSQTTGVPSAPLTITLINDPKDPNAGVVNFKGNALDELTDYAIEAGPGACVNGTSLAPGASCTITVVFTPQSVGYKQGTITMGYSTAAFGSTPQTQTIHLRGMGQLEVLSNQSQISAAPKARVARQ